MTVPLDPAWTQFFATAADATATLVGLIIVAVSVNLQRILAYRALPSRAAAGVSALVLSLVASMAALLPQPTAMLGIELLVAAVFVWLIQVRSTWQLLVAPRPERRPAGQLVVTGVLSQVQVLPFVVGGCLLLAGRAAGADWIAGGVLVTFAGSVFTAWILLVEIMR